MSLDLSAERNMNLSQYFGEELTRMFWDRLAALGLTWLLNGRPKQRS